MSDNIKVVVKVRPLIQREIEDKLSVQWRVSDDTLYQLDQNGEDLGPSFTFDKVYGEDALTTTVYDDIAKPIVEAATKGFNGTIFAYGQTSSGKTYTMAGTKTSLGIVPLAIMDLFNIIKSKEDRDFLVRVSYIEIYNDIIKDLLNIKKENIKIHETYSGVKVDVTETVTSSPEEVFKAMKQGETNRHIGATNMNEESSRSHTIFQITIESREHTEMGDATGSVNVSQLNLVDLAGSERSGQTGATGIRFKEGTHINKSLSTLGHVIKQLSEDHRYVNYRDSKLTRILQNSLGGNAKTSIICAVTPAAVDETISTFQFANRAKSIKNKPEVNAVATNKSMIQDLTKKLAKLQSQLESKKDLEKDNHILTKKIEILQRQIINGFSHRSTADINRRKTWCAPRRATIDALPSIDEAESLYAIPRFCTPALKYNPSSIPSSLECERGGSLPRVSEVGGAGGSGGQVTPPLKKQVAFTDEVIEIDSDDDATEGGCSPYHKCHDATKTPPCVLRKKAKKAEQDLKEIVEFTEREKIYKPDVNELMDKLDQNTTIISMLEDENNCLKQKYIDRETEITALTNTLNTKIKDLENNVQSINSEKNKLETLCNEYKTKLTDMEVSYETLKKKAEIREKDLLSLLNEQNNRLKKNEKSLAVDKELVNFMNMSRDVSLVYSDNESSIVHESPATGTAQVQDLLLSDLQAQIANKNRLITDMETELENYKQITATLVADNGGLKSEVSVLTDKIADLELEKSVVTTKIETLQCTIAQQKLNLDSANDEIDSYCAMIQELNAKLRENVRESLMIDDTALQNMIDNEHQIIANNDNLRNILHCFKASIDARNKEISELKSNIHLDIQEKEKQIKEIDALVSENSSLKQLRDFNVSQISIMTQEKDDLSKENKELQTELANVKDEFKKSYSLNVELSSSNTSFAGKVTKLTALIEEIEADVNQKTEKIVELQNKLQEANERSEELITRLSETAAQTDNLTSLLEQLKNDISEKDDEIDALQNLHRLVTSKIIFASRKTIQLTCNLTKNEAGTENPDEFYDVRDVADSLEKLVSHVDSTTDLFNNESEMRKKRVTDSSDADQYDNMVDYFEIIFEKIVQKYLKIKEELFEVKHELSDYVRQSEEVWLIALEHKENCAANNKLKDEQISTYKTQIEELKTANKDLQSEVDSLQQYYNDNLNDTTAQKDNTIQELTQKVKALEESQTKADVDSHHMENIFDVLCMLTQQHGLELPENLASSPDGKKHESVLLLLKQVQGHLETVRTESVNLETALTDSKTELLKMNERNGELIKEVDKYRESYRELCAKLENLENDNDVLKNRLVECSELMTSLKTELVLKVEDLKELSTSSQCLQEKLTSMDRSMKQKILNLQADNTELSIICSNLETKCKIMSENLYCLKCNGKVTQPIDFNQPKSLISICCNTLMESLNNNEINLNITSPMPVVTSNGEAQVDLCQCKELQTQLHNSKEEIENLKNTLKYFRESNKLLLDEQELVREELRLLAEPAYELEKKIGKHRTVLSSLRATTYTENKLLKSQVKFLEHHHKRFHNVFVRDIPEFKKQLIELYGVLKSDSALYDKHNLSLKRFSLPVVLDTNSSIATLQSESTLEGDLLMFDTNFTLNATDNTLPYNEQTCFDMSQVNIETDNLSNSENVSSVTVLEHNSMRQLVEDNQNLSDVLHSMNEENMMLINQFKNRGDCQTSAILCEPSVSSLCVNKSTQLDRSLETDVACEACRDKAAIAATAEQVGKQMLELQKRYLDLENRYQSQNGNVPSTETLQRKLIDIEKEHIITVTKLTNQIAAKTKEIKQIQEENDALSSEIMDRISEVDDLKKELDNVKARNVDLEQKCLPVLSENKECDKTERLTRALRETLNASKEDCRKVTHELVTIKNHELERTNMSLVQNLSLDSSMNESNIFTLTKDLNQSVNIINLKASEKSPDIYLTEKMECIQYLSELTGVEKENLNRDLKIIDIMKMLYNKLLLQHGNEVHNLNNQLTEYEEKVRTLDSQIDELTERYHKVCEEFDESKKYVNSLVVVITKVKEHCKEIVTFDPRDDIYAKLVEPFKQNVLVHLDACLDLSTAKVFEKLIDFVATKHQKECLTLSEGYSALQNHMQAVAEEFQTVKENLNQMKDQLSAKEIEYNHLKEQKERMHEISSAVTRDIISQERTLRKVLEEGCRKLVEGNVIASDHIDVSLPLDKSISMLFERLTKQNNLIKIENEKQQLAIELKNSTAKLIEKESEISSLLSKQQASTESLTEEILDLRKKISQQESQISSLHSEIESTRSNEQQINNLKQTVHSLNMENKSLKSINDELCREIEENAKELEKTSQALISNKEQIENMTKLVSNLQKSCNQHIRTIDSLKADSKQLLEKNIELGHKFSTLSLEAETLQSKYAEKCEMCSQLELNNKTHEKTVEIQNKMINRLQNEKDAIVLTLTEKSAQIVELTAKCEALQTQLENTPNVEMRLSDVDGRSNSGRGRESLDQCGSVRKRRQSLHDSKRMFPEKTDNDLDAVEEMFASRPKPEDLFLDAEDGSSNRSSPTCMRHGESVSSLSETSGRVSAARRRRWSTYDARRSVASPRESLLAKELTSARYSRSPDTSVGENNSSVSQLRAQIESYQLKLSELEEKCKELDEECEICAERLQESDALCVKLKKEKEVLKKTITELRRGNSTCAPTKEAGVNTDEDWTNLHSVVVDRMSYDAEVEKNKKLTRAIEEFRAKNRHLRATIAKLQHALESNEGKQSPTDDSEVDSYRRQTAELEARAQELAQDLARAQSRLQALERVAAKADVSTHTGDDLLSYQVERDDAFTTLQSRVERAPRHKSTMERTPHTFVAGGSAIVQSQQLSDIVKENLKLKSINAKLVNICRKRGVTDFKQRDDDE